MNKPWLVRMHHRMRSASFAMLFIASWLHLADQAPGLITWALLVALFLVYPQLQYWRSSRADDSVKTEMSNMMVDAVLLGVYMAAMGFAVWLSFSSLIGILTNTASNHGWRGVPKALLALLLGMGLWVALEGLTFSPQSSWQVMAFCMVGLSGYLVTIGHIGFNRNLQLRQIQQQLQARKTELIQANQALSGHLLEIEALHPSYACGQVDLDEHHRALFAQINALLAAVLCEHPLNEVVACVDALMDDVTTHFAQEEHILQQTGFPAAQAHATLHRELLDRAAYLTARFKSHDMDTGELFQFLASDLVARHMLGADRAFDLSALYARRWNIELDLRNLKTTTGMDVMSCQTPQMNEKQLWVHLLAYNAIRLLMAQAASKAGVDPRELSFKHTVQLWTEWVSRGLSTANIDARLLTLIGQCRVANRPGRIEPRMRKRRPKPYPWLKGPRAHARQKIRTHGRAWETK